MEQDGGRGAEKRIDAAQGIEHGHMRILSALAAPVNVKSCDLNTSGGCSVSISTSLRSSFCHLTSTLSAMMLTASGGLARATTERHRESSRVSTTNACNASLVKFSQLNFTFSRRPWKRQSHAAQQNIHARTGGR